MRHRFKFFLVLIILTFTFIYAKPVFAETITDNVSGAWTMYLQDSLTNGELMSGYDSTISGISLPSSTYTQLSPYDTQFHNYTVATQVDLQFTYPFQSNVRYTIQLHFDFGSYIYQPWPNSSSPAWFFNSCPGTSCSLNVVYTTDSTHTGLNTLDLVLNFIPSSDSNSITFNFGNTTDSMGMFYNAYTSQQGIKITTATISYDEDMTMTAAQDIIDAQNANTQEIINQIIINNQNAINAQQVCTSNSITINSSNKDSYDNGFIYNNGTVYGADSNYKHTDYIPISNGDIVNLNLNYTNSNLNICFFDTSKVLKSCTDYTSTSNTFNIDFDGFVRFSAAVYNNSVSTIYIQKVCKNGNQAINDALTDSNVDSGIGGNFLNGLSWYENSYFSSIITSPLQFLQSLGQACQPVTFEVFGQSVSLPCGTTIFWDRGTEFPQIATFRLFWNVLLGGFLIYKLAHKLIVTINDCLDPTKDKVGEKLV